MRLPIQLQREIARLHFYGQRQSHRSIAAQLGLSHSTVSTMRKLLVASNLSLIELQPLTDEEWRKILGNENRSIAQRKIGPDWHWVQDLMQRPDATLEVIWREWRESHPDGIGYSSFTDGYRAWVKKRHIVMRRTHIPGDKLFVDFAGRTVEIKGVFGKGCC